jgi:hypothetical protein
VAKLRDKIQNGLDEGRILVLGTQVLLGFGLRIVFEPGFEALGRGEQCLGLVALGLLLVTLTLIIAPGTYHQIIDGGHDTDTLHEYLRATLSAALLPLAIAIGIAVQLASARLLGGWSLAAGGGVTAVALFAWYGVELWKKPQHKEPRPMKKEDADLSHRIRHVLTEARVVLPGAQALLGFQFLTMMVDAFTRLPRSSQVVHLCSLLLITLATILLMVPAAYHRLVLAGEETEEFHDLASRMVLSALVPLGLGIAGDLYVVSLKILGSIGAALAISGSSLLLFYGLWFAVPLALRLWRSPAPTGRLTA